MPIPSAMTAEICAHAGFEYILIDSEHGPTDTETAYHMMLAAERGGAVPLVRVPMNHPQVILRYLDIGAAGIMVPQVNSAEEARGVVESIKYHPEGRRGIAASRSSAWTITQPLSEFAGTANRDTMVIVQFENIKSLDRVPEIIEVPGVDVLFIGPNDLAQSMGHPGQTGHPDVQKVIEDVCALAREKDIILGTVAADSDTANVAIGRGIQMITANSAALLAGAAKGMLSGINR